MFLLKVLIVFPLDPTAEAKALRDLAEEPLHDFLVAAGQLRATDRMMMKHVVAVLQRWQTYKPMGFKDEHLGEIASVLHVPPPKPGKAPKLALQAKPGVDRDMVVATAFKVFNLKPLEPKVGEEREGGGRRC
jgi:hypothetical protein